MKYLFLLFSCLNLFMPPALALSVDSLENLFKSKIPVGVIYTKVPRGLIVSLDEKLFFNNCSPLLKESSLYILDSIAELLKEISNYCVIENHVNEKICSENLESWELSAMRSANIVEYLVKYNEIPADRVFDIGFGETMPFRENVNPSGKTFNNRVDFVLIEYEAKR